MGCSTIPYFGYGKKTARSKGSRLLTRETDRSLRFSSTRFTKGAASDGPCFLSLAKSFLPVDTRLRD